MDKTEYKIKLDQINALVDENDYEGALEVVESIDWRRVKSVRTLCMVADIYEVCDMLEDCKKILLLAYKRSSIGKMILFRLVEISLKMGDIDEAVEYYTEFAQTAPGDHSRYILKYKIYSAKKSPIEDRIAILEDYNEKEYTERWAYELAKLYSKAGMKDKCIEVIDDLFLWFSEGTYVMKALELKMKYKSLSPSQQQKYDNRHLYEEQEEAVLQKAREEKERIVPDSTERILKKLQDAGDELAMGVQQAQQAALEAAVTLESEQREETTEPKLKPVDAEELAGMESEAAAAVKNAESIEAAENAQPDPSIMPVEPENLKERLASSFRDVLSGIYKGKEEVKKEYAAEDEQEEEIVDYRSVKELEPESFKETAVIHTQELKKVWAPLAEEPAMPPAVEGEGEEDDFIQKLLQETASNLAQQVSGGAYKEEPAAESEEMQNLGEGAEAESEEAAEEPEIEDTTEEPEIKLEEAAEKPEMESEEATEKPEMESGEAVEEPETESEEAAEELREEAQETAPEEPVVELSIEERILAEETPEQKRTRILNDTRPEKFTDEQKKLFTYFAKVPGMDQQILDALNGVYLNASDKTSKRGNIAVMGSQGSGKTHLTDNLVRAISSDLGLEAVKMARLSGNAMNEKDPAQIVGKMSGGFLLIEAAGLMTDETIAKLSQALEFRTDSLILIIEDEKTRMRKLLAEHESFAKKFGTVISIPVFTNDELVTFARTYAKELGYKIDELGVLALYTRIGERQTEDSPMTVALVKEIVDKAILKAHRGKIGRKVSGKRLDPEGRIVLFEKDFDF